MADTQMTDAQNPNKRKEPEISTSLEMVDPTAEPQQAAEMELQKKKKADKQAESSKDTELITFKRLRMKEDVPPKILASLRNIGELGYRRPSAQRVLTHLVYELDSKAISDSVERLISHFVVDKETERGDLSPATLPGEVLKIAKLTADAVMSALYAKLRSIHKSVTKYGTRYSAPATYNKSIELPLPYADCIDQLGVFESVCMKTNQLVMPTYAEGTKHEGRQREEFNVYDYQAYIPILKALGMPFKSVDTRIRQGSPWWTYRAKKVGDSYDLETIFPPLMYSDTSAIQFAMFIFEDEETKALVPIRKSKDSDDHYATRYRDIQPAEQLRCFSALCGYAGEEWSFNYTLE